MDISKAKNDLCGGRFFLFWGLLFSFSCAILYMKYIENKGAFLWVTTS